MKVPPDNGKNIVDLFSKQDTGYTKDCLNNSKATCCPDACKMMVIMLVCTRSRHIMHEFVDFFICLHCNLHNHILLL